MIETYFNDTILHKVANSVDKWGITTGIEVEQPCRIEYKTRLIRNQQGEQVVSNIRVFFSANLNSATPAGAVKHTDKFSIDGVEHSVLAIAKPSSFATQYVQVDLQ